MIDPAAPVCLAVPSGVGGGLAVILGGRAERMHVLERRGAHVVKGDDEKALQAPSEPSGTARPCAASSAQPTDLFPSAFVVPPRRLRPQPKEHAFDDETVVEIAGAVVHYTAFNAIAHGMMLRGAAR